MTTSIASGAIERDEEGRIVAVIQTRSPYQSLQELNDRIGLKDLELSSPDEYISRDKEVPTQFVGQYTLRIPAGENILDLQTWQKIKMPINTTCVTTTTAVGYLENNVFSGTFNANFDYKEINLTVRLSGKFSVTLS